MELTKRALEIVLKYIEIDRKSEECLKSAKRIYEYIQLMASIYNSEYTGKDITIKEISICKCNEADRKIGVYMPRSESILNLSIRLICDESRVEGFMRLVNDKVDCIETLFEACKKLESIQEEIISAFEKEMSIRSCHNDGKRILDLIDSEHENSKEYVIIENKDGTSVYLRGWRTRDDSSKYIVYKSVVCK